MKDFIILLSTRIRKNTIKQYKPIGETKVNIYYSVSRYKVEVETFDFITKKKRTAILEYLDSNFLI